MAITVWPTNAVADSPKYAGRALRQTTTAPFLAGAKAARPLGAISGVRPGTPASTVSCTATTWTVAPFAGVIDAEAAAEAGPYTFASDTNVTGALPAANASNPYAGILYVQVSDPAESDGSALPGVKVDFLGGDPAANPLAPGDPGASKGLPARSYVIGRVNMPKAGGGNPTVTWVAPYTAAAGGIIPAVSSTQMATLTPALGTYLDLTASTDLQNYPLGLYRGNGTAWVPVTADTGWIALAVTGGRANTTNPPRFRRVGTEVKLDGYITPTDTQQTIGTLPAGFRPGVERATWCDRNLATQWVVRVRAGGAIVLVGPSGGAGDINLGGFTPFDADN